MKRFHKYIFGASLLSIALVSTSCVDETEPTHFASQAQASASSASTRALVYAMPAYFNHVDEDLLDNNNWHAVFGYGSMMIIRDLQTNDRSIGKNYSGHFKYFAQDQYMGKRYTYSYYPWSYYYGFVLTTNKVIAAIDINNCSDDQKGYYGIASAFRALCYLDLARSYEFLKNDKIEPVSESGKNVEGLTVPIVTDTIGENEARNNPRATRAEMAKFIENDLNNAEQYIKFSPEDTNILPDLACVYGLKARLYMWLEDYANASKYAKLAITTTSSKPMTESECLDAQKGFNDISKWMWGAQQTSEDNSVTTGIVNWTSWVCNETTFGYAGVGAYNLIDANLYDQIDDNDFRKKEFIGPNGPSQDQKLLTGLKQAYASLKFRPNEGNADSYQTGAASAYPIMRVEEMYFIWAEAEAHMDAAQGKADLIQIMKTDLKRNPQYTFDGTSTEEVVNEIVKQKRIELFGEGQSFFDFKRLNMSVDRTYKGSNWLDLAKFKTNGRPAWMNWVIPQNEEKNNSALADYNNPDPSDAYAKK